MLQVLVVESRTNAEVDQDPVTKGSKNLCNIMSWNARCNVKAVRVLFLFLTYCDHMCLSFSIKIGTFLGGLLQV